MKRARDRTLGSSVFYEADEGRRMWEGTVDRGRLQREKENQEREMSWKPKRRHFPEAQCG